MIRKLSFALLTRGGSIGLSMAAMFLISRMLGPEEAGVYFIGTTLALSIASVAKLGLDSAVMKQRAREEANHGNHMHIFEYEKVAIIASIGLCLATTIFISITGTFKNLPITVLAAFLLSAPLLALLTISSGALQGVGKVYSSTIVLSVPAATPLIAIAIRRENLTPEDAAYAFLLGTAATYFFTRTILNTEHKSLSLHETSNAQVISMIKGHWPFFIFSVGGFVQAKIHIFIMSGHSMLDQIAIFNICERVSSVVGFALAAANSFFAQRFQHHAALGDLKSTQQLGEKLTIAVSAISLIPLLTILYFSTEILGIAGTEFESGANTLKTLAICQIACVMTGPVGFILIALDEQKALAISVVFSLSLGTLLSIFLTPAYSSLGAAVALGTSLVFQNISCSCYLYYKKKMLVIPFLNKIQLLKQTQP